MILRPAEVAIIIYICVKYAIEPLKHVIGLEQMDADDKNHLYKLLAVATICNQLFTSRKSKEICSVLKVYRFFLFSF